jgi:hypothetical protein
MPSPRKFVSDLPILSRKKRGRPATKCKNSKDTTTTTQTTVTQATRDRLLSEAVQCYGVTIEPSVLKAWLGLQLERFLSKLPWWYGRTESADAATRRNRRRYQVEHGQIEKQEVPAGLAEWQRRQRELCLEDGFTAEETITDATTNQEETTQEHQPTIAV